MAYIAKAIDVPKTSKTFTINLKAQGTMSKTVMGHNLVITKEADKDAANIDSGNAGVTNNFVKAKKINALLQIQLLLLVVKLPAQNLALT